MRSSLPFCESMYGWFHLVMRDTVKVKCVCALSCVCLWNSDVCAHTVCCLCVCFVMWLAGWVGGMGGGGGGGVWSVCLFVFVSGSRLLQSAPLAVMARLWDTDIKLSDWSLSALKCLELSIPICQPQGDQSSMASVWRSLICCVFVREGTKLRSSYYVHHVRFLSIRSFKRMLFSFPYIYLWFFSRISMKLWRGVGHDPRKGAFSIFGWIQVVFLLSLTLWMFKRVFFYISIDFSDINSLILMKNNRHV